MVDIVPIAGSGSEFCERHDLSIVLSFKTEVRYEVMCEHGGQRGCCIDYIKKLSLFLRNALVLAQISDMGPCCFCFQQISQIKEQAL
jgi:hypothetical protein